MKRPFHIYTGMIHENLGIIMSFAYSHLPLAEFVAKRFRGSSASLRKTLFGLPQLRAERALLELAVHIRALDESEGISAYHEATRRHPDCGRLVMELGAPKVLVLREVANKVIHSERFEWTFAEDGAPGVTVYPDTPSVTKLSAKQRWKCAEVNLQTLTFVCGTLL